MFLNTSLYSQHIAYILTQDYNADHIQQLVEQFDRNSIPYNLQKQTDTLGQSLDRRYFVVVDNIKGTVVLGPEFSSLLMFIVGYPRRGINKKNHYCKKAQDVIGKYNYFCHLPNPQKTTFKTSKIKSKSQLKTIKSIPRSRSSSEMLHQKSQSIINKGKEQSKIRSFTNLLSDLNNERKSMISKIFLLKSAGRYKQYNNTINKLILNSNPEKFKVVQTFDQFVNCLQNCQSLQNQLLISQQNLKPLQIYKQKDPLDSKLQNLNIVVYNPPNLQNSTKKNNKQILNAYDVSKYCLPSNDDNVKLFESLDDLILQVINKDKQIQYKADKSQIKNGSKINKSISNNANSKLCSSTKKNKKKIVWAKTFTQSECEQPQQRQSSELQAQNKRINNNPHASQNNKADHQIRKQQASSVNSPEVIQNHEFRKYANSQNQIGELSPRMVQHRHASKTCREILLENNRNIQDIKTDRSQQYQLLSLQGNKVYKVSAYNLPGQHEEGRNNKNNQPKQQTGNNNIQMVGNNMCKITPVPQLSNNQSRSHSNAISIRNMLPESSNTIAYNKNNSNNINNNIVNNCNNNDAGNNGIDQNIDLKLSINKNLYQSIETTNPKKVSETPNKPKIKRISIQAKKLVVRKVKRVKSQYNGDQPKNNNSFVQNNPNLTDNQETAFLNGKSILSHPIQQNSNHIPINNSVKVEHRKRYPMENLPAQYYTPISPVTQPLIPSLKQMPVYEQPQQIKRNNLIVRKLRCRSQQPQIQTYRDSEDDQHNDQKQRVRIGRPLLRRSIKISKIQPATTGIFSTQGIEKGQFEPEKVTASFNYYNQNPYVFEDQKKQQPLKIRTNASLRPAYSYQTQNSELHKRSDGLLSTNQTNFIQTQGKTRQTSWLHREQKPVGVCTFGYITTSPIYEYKQSASQSPIHQLDNYYHIEERHNVQVRQSQFPVKRSPYTHQNQNYDYRLSKLNRSDRANEEQEKSTTNNRIYITNNDMISPRYSQQNLKGGKQSKLSINSQQISFTKRPENKSPSGRQPKSVQKPVCLLWKQFNFDIEETIKQFRNQLDIRNSSLVYNVRSLISSYSFYRVQELQKIIRSLPKQSRLIIMLDDLQLQGYLDALSSIDADRENKGEKQLHILSIYLYPKSGDSILSLKSLTSIVLPGSINRSRDGGEEIRSRRKDLIGLMRIVLSNQYFNNNSKIVNEILNGMCSNQGQSDIYLNENQVRSLHSNSNQSSLQRRQPDRINSNNIYNSHNSNSYDVSWGSQRRRQLDYTNY